MRVVAQASAILITGFVLLLTAARHIGTTLNSPQLTVIHREGAVHLLDLRLNALFPLVEDLHSTPVVFHWSPDGHKLMYTLINENRYTVYILDLLTHKTTQIAEQTLITSSGAWSPDGDTLAMLSPTFDICLYKLSAQQNQCLGLTLANFPVWTPDGQALVINIAIGSDAGVYRVNPQTAEVEKLGTLPPTNLPPVWSPDGQRMAFLVTPMALSTVSQIHVAKADGSAIRILTDDDGEKLEFSWSPDSRSIIYTVETYRNRDLYRVDVESGEIQPVMDAANVIEARPAWSPDGSLLAFVHYASGDLELYLMDGKTLAPESSRPVISILSYNFAWRP